MAGIEQLLITPRNKLGSIEIQATIEEVYNDTLAVTEHPTETGAMIADHAYMKPQELVIKCGWSNSSTDALVGAIQSLFNGSMTVGDYVAGVYSQLLALQQSRQPFAITTTLRQYQNMLITGLSQTRDKTTSNALMVTATCRQIFIVNTQVTQLPAQANQAQPSKTAEMVNSGVKNALRAIPSPGGSLPIP